MNFVGYGLDARVLLGSSHNVYIVAKCIIFGTFYVGSDGYREMSAIQTIIHLTP